MSDNWAMASSDSGIIVAKSLEIARERWVDLQDAIASNRRSSFVMDDEGTAGEGTNELNSSELPATGRF
jgi:hypothetical protein